MATIKTNDIVWEPQCSARFRVDIRMCKEYRWVITFASVSGLIQSILWMGLGIAGALVYLCLLPVAPYKNEDDFFRVTLIKLYFEGPKCRPDGSYLGRFDNDYKSVVHLFTQDLVFALMIAYVILNAVFFTLSARFFSKRKSKSKRGIALAWSTVCLILCAIDAFFTFVLVYDVFTLKDYTSNRPEGNLPAKYGEIPDIPLALAMLSSRFIAVWLWNFIFGFVIFMDALCCRNIIRKPPKMVEKSVEEPQKPAETQKPQIQRQQEITAISGSNRNPYRDYTDYRRSMEATTRFNVPQKQQPLKENPERVWSYPPPEGYWQPRQPNKEWEMTNEGYVSDEGEKQPDFDHDLRNFEPGQRKIQLVKPPMGKPVRVPVPPPFPSSSSCNC